MLETNNGFIKIHRSILNWEWYQNSTVKNLFLHLLLRANHTDQKWEGRIIKRGQLVTSYQHLSDELSKSKRKHSNSDENVSVMRVRTALNKLKSTHEITSESTNEYTVITITNYDTYQSINTQVNKIVTSGQQADNKRLTTNKNVKNEKNVKNIYSSPNLISHEDVKEIAEKYQVSVKAVERKLDDLKDAVEANSTKYKYSNYKAALRNWVKMGIERGQIQVVENSPAEDMIAEAIRRKNAQ